ncbi:MAG: proline--tRNA ligase [Actinobacteria bacterium]|nr:proline--tRNA ligase [Actinomycetota bacterium]
MKYSMMFIPTLKEDPGEAEIPSHALTLRAGLIRKIASGIYSFLPLGLRVLKKIERIIREEMNNAGGIEVILPVIQPSELWKKSGRWDEYGPDMFRLRDRNDRDFCLGPTHEELITYMAHLDIKSYKELPLNLYQIQVKFRDEIRPRYGLLRAREFIMKDAYSFCSNVQDLDLVYNKMYSAYIKIMERIGLSYKVVNAETGLIGGNVSHEFIVLAGDGEERLVYCPECGYSANMEMADFACAKKNKENTELKEIKEVSTPGIRDIDSLSKFLNTGKGQTLKTILVMDNRKKIYAFIMSGDRELNITKAGKSLGKNLELSRDEEPGRNLKAGFLGPVGLEKDIEIYADHSVSDMKNFVTGANREDMHLINVNTGRDFKVRQWGNFSYACDGDNCIECGAKLKFEKGIEIGHIFKLGTKYSEKFGARFLDKDGKLRPFVMGCYGIGVTRMLSAIVEQNHDDKGIAWPVSVAPYHINIITTTAKDPNLSEAAEDIYSKLLKMGVEVLYDDRDLSAGIKFKDSDLIGIPVRFIIGKKYIDKKVIDVETRMDRAKTELPVDSINGFIKEFKSRNNI